jgi:hypothetical protein
MEQKQTLKEGDTMNTQILIGNVYYFPTHYHVEQMQVVNVFEETECIGDIFETFEVVTKTVVKVLYLNSELAGTYQVFTLQKLQEDSLPVCSEFIELYADDDGKEFAVVDGDSIQTKTVEGDYIELKNGVWLRSLRDGRYIDDENENVYSATYRRSNDGIESTGYYVRYVNRSFNGWWLSQSKYATIRHLYTMKASRIDADTLLQKAVEVAKNARTSYEKKEAISFMKGLDKNA